MLRLSHVFTVFTGVSNFAAKLFAAPAVVIRKQHQLLPIRLQPSDAFQEPLQFLGHLAPRQRIRRIGGDFHRGRLFFDRNLGPLANDIDGPVSRNRRHPCDRGRHAGIELPRAVPDLDVSLLNDLLREILTPQDTQHHAEEFRARGGIKPLESRLIPLRNRGNQPDQLSRRQHSSVPKTRGFLDRDCIQPARPSSRLVSYFEPGRSAKCGTPKENVGRAA